MEPDEYPLEHFVADLRRLVASTTDERELLSTLRPMAKRAALSPGWRRDSHYRADPDQGFGVNVLHDEPDRSLFIAAISWLPGRGVQCHDHGTWAVIVGVDGPEKNTFWERTDDRSQPGRATLRRIGEKVFGAGDVIAMPNGAIHSVVNESDRTSLSFHVYGRHLNHAQRSQYDPAAGTEAPFILKTQ